MEHLKSLIILGVCSCIGVVSLHAQRRDYVAQTILTNVTTAPVTSPLIQNIGQVSHQVTVVVNSAPAHTCTVPNVKVQFQGAFDGVNFVKIFTIAQANAFSGTALFVFQNNGITAPYPYLRVRVDGFDTTNCLLSTVNYTGSIYPSQVWIQPSQGQVPQFTQTLVGTTTAGAGATTLASTTNTNGTVVPYSLTIANLGTLNDAVTIGWSVAANCTSPVTYSNSTVIAVPAGNTASITPSLTPILYTDGLGGQNSVPLCMSWGAQASRSLQVTTTFRVE